VNTVAAKRYVLVVYPLSSHFRDKVEDVLGPDAISLFLAELRNMGTLSMLKFLRGLDKDSSLYIPLEDKNSEALLPLLLGVAACSSAGKIYVIDASGSTRQQGRSQALLATLSAAFSSICGFLSLLRAWFSVTLLQHRLPLTVSEGAGEILYLNANLWFGVKAGGSVGHIAGVVNAFTDAGYKVDLVSANDQVMLRDTARQTLLQPPRTFGYPHEMNYIRYNYSTLRQVRSLVAQREYQFLYQRMSVMNYAGVVLSRLMRVPLVLEYNGSEVWVAKNWGRPLRFGKFGLAIENVCLKHAHRIVVVSRVLAEELVDRGVEPEKIVCYPNCVDPLHYSPERVLLETKAALRGRYNISTDAVLVAFVGTFGQWHGAPVLAAAIKQLVDNEPQWLQEYNVCFAMIGDGVRMKEVRELIGGPRYAKWVVFTGLVPQAETVNYLALTDILVSPHVANADGSRFFGSPTKLFEYMAMGKGIVASDLDQIGEVLSAGIRTWQNDDRFQTGRIGATAILTRPGNVADLIDGVKLLVEQPELRCQLGLNARSELLKRYTWSHHVQHILESLREQTFKDSADVALAEPAR